MRLTCRPPDRVKSKEQQQQQHFEEQPQSVLHQRPSQTMSVIPSTPLSPTITQSLVATPVQQTTPTPTSPPQAQFYSAPHPSTSAPLPPDNEPRSLTPPASSNSVAQNDILKRIVKADNNGIKKKQRLENNAHHFKAIKGSVVPPPPLSKYKRPPPIIPNRPGERYPLGIPYIISETWTNCRQLCAREDCAQNSKASVSRHCISEYVQKGARGSCIPKDLRVEWCNTCYMTYDPLTCYVWWWRLMVVIDGMRIIILVYFHFFLINWRFVRGWIMQRLSLHCTKIKKS